MISFALTDHEWKVSLTQTGVSTLVAIGGGTSPILNEEQSQTLARTRQVVLLRVQHDEHLIARDSVVEVVD